MEDIFKRNLLSLRQPTVATTFGQALLGTTLWNKTLRVKKVEVAPVGFSEKTEVIQSLERFAQEKVVETKLNVISIPGGEIAIKPDPVWDGIKPAATLKELKESLSLEASVLDLILNSKKPGEVKVLFVAENSRKWDEIKAELKGGFLDELLPSFPLKSAEYFQKMLAGMKLNQAEVALYPIEGEQGDLSAEIMKVAVFLRPEIIVTLGAKAAQRILKSQDRLQTLHGQFFTRKVEGTGIFQIVPLFHPSIIEANQNMKKTAWVDMQKIMKQLKILP